MDSVIMTAHRAFQFCKQYKRATEFRRLCEIIRNHLSNLNKYRDQRDRPDLTAPESLQLYLDTRVDQLKMATDLKLWQEAFRSVEDIHGLMCMVKKTPKPSVMVVYYAKLAEIFWVSGSHLYHAYAWLKLFTFQKRYNKKLSQNDLQLIASSVLLAALSVAPYDQNYGASHMDLENENERNMRMATLISFSLDNKQDNREVLSRSMLFNDLSSKGVLTCASQEVKDLYNLLEHDFLPLDLSIKVQPLLTKISKLGGVLASASSVPEVQLSQYVSAPRSLLVSQVYQSMKIDNLSKMIPFFEPSILEKIQVDAKKYNFVALRIDHQKGVVHFGNLDLESDKFHDHLTLLAVSLNNARNMIYPPSRKVSTLGESFIGLSDTVDMEHKRLLARKSLIEKRKEEHERHMLEMEREEESKKLKLQKITEEAEQKRLATEYTKREEKRIRLEIEERELQEAKALLLETEKRSGKRNKKRQVIEGEKVTKEALLEMALSEQLKERQEMEKKLQKLGKTMDYLERAKREEEAELIEFAFQHRLEEEQRLHEQEQLMEIDRSRDDHAGNVQEKKRLTRMLEHKILFQNQIVNKRESEFNRLKKEKEDKIKELRAIRMSEKIRKYKLQHYLICEEERLDKLREEEEARKLEEAERKKKEDAEKKIRLDEIAEKQRRREEELEQKERLRRESLGRITEPAPRPIEPVSAVSRPSEPITTSAASATNKYVPKFRRTAAAPAASPAASTPQTEKWNSRPSNDRPPSGDKWKPDDRKGTAFGDRSSRLSTSSTWTSRSRT
ncbi:putative Eukaryotic translation initiation factor 3 subunit [Zostera marina]|uniref:Putative Eukaryotic translation initiation factor 3 subunit n=1 Tax=Zostera marina TaxID=29655 RepID=A0A0K9Q4K0_ZOSMR|nr:putative Eukaryotic translation initiation factor 3 subunit [Zostera marina]